jgi:hypothetical protein
MYVEIMDLFVNRWFAKYEQARSILEKEGDTCSPTKASSSLPSGKQSASSNSTLMIRTGH